MAEIASAFVTIAPSARGFGSSLNRQVTPGVTSAGRGIGRTFGKMFVLGASLIAAAGIGNFLKGSLDEAREAQKVGAATAQIIKTTGGAAKITAAQVGALATEISLKTGIDDEAIQSGQNMLLTFKNVRNEVGKGNDVFNRATQAMLDLSSLKGMAGVEGSSKALGKALNDPIAGITALSRAGVQFTDQQKEQIKGFVASGDTLKAQKIILGEVESQVGGLAEAQATAGDKAKVAYDNLKESIGTALLPVMDSLAKAFVKLAPSIQRGIEGIGPAFARAKAFLTPFVNAVIGFFHGSGGTSIKEFAATFQTKVMPAIKQVADFVVTRLVPIFTQYVAIIQTQVIPILASLAQWFITKILPVIVDLYRSIATSLAPTFVTIADIIQTQVLPGVSKLLTKFHEYQPTIQKVVGVVLKLWAGFIKFQVAIIGKVLPVLIRLAAWLIGNLFKAIGTVITQLVAGVRGFISFGKAIVKVVDAAVEFAKGVIKQGARVLDFVKAMPGKIKGFFKNLPGALSKIGAQIIDGLVGGIKAAAHKVADAVQAIINKIPKKIRELMGISSPSKVTYDLGKMIMEGLARGVEEGGKKAVKKTKEAVAKLRETLSGLKSDFASLVDPIRSAFTSDLFSATSASSFVTSLMGTKGQLKGLVDAFAVLIKGGFNPKFLYDLFASGNAGLILDLANNPALAAQASSLLGDVNQLSTELGQSVAGATPDGKAITKKIDKTNEKLDKLIDHVDRAADRTAEALTEPAKHARRRAVRA